MFDIGWSELLIIAAVAIVVVGPKDLPRMLRTFGNYAGKARKVANDFKRQFDEALREAELDDVRKSVEDMGKLPTLTDLTKATEKTAPAAAEVKPAAEATPAAAGTQAAETEATDAAPAAVAVTAEAPVSPSPEPVPAEPKT